MHRIREPNMPTPCLQRAWLPSTRLAAIGRITVLVMVGVDHLGHVWVKYVYKVFIKMFIAAAPDCHTMSSTESDPYARTLGRRLIALNTAIFISLFLIRRPSLPAKLLFLALRALARAVMPVLALTLGFVLVLSAIGVLSLSALALQFRASATPRLPPIRTYLSMPAHTVKHDAKYATDDGRSHSNTPATRPIQDLVQHIPSFSSAISDRETDKYIWMLRIPLKIAYNPAKFRTGVSRSYLLIYSKGKPNVECGAGSERSANT